MLIPQMLSMGRFVKGIKKEWVAKGWHGKGEVQSPVHIRQQNFPSWIRLLNAIVLIALHKETPSMAKDGGIVVRFHSHSRCFFIGYLNDLHFYAGLFILK